MYMYILLITAHKRTNLIIQMRYGYYSYTKNIMKSRLSSYFDFVNHFETYLTLLASPSLNLLSADEALKCTLLKFSKYLSLSQFLFSLSTSHFLSPKYYRELAKYYRELALLGAKLANGEFS